MRARANARRDERTGSSAASVDLGREVEHEALAQEAAERHHVPDERLSGRAPGVDADPDARVVASAG